VKNKLAPLVSIVVPIYNVENYVSRLLESIVSQTYKNIELILVNDGSLDKSIDIAINFLKDKDLCWKVLNKENGGAASARNSGISVSRGEWVICPDADDYLAPCMIERLVSEAIKRSVLCAFCKYSSVYPEQIASVKFHEKCVKSYSAKQMRYLFLERRLQLVSPAMLVHRSVCEEIRYNEACPYDEDIYFIWQVLFVCDSFAFIDGNYYLYVTRKTSSVHTLTGEKYLATSKQYQQLENDLIASYPEMRLFIKRIHPKYRLGGLHVLAKSTCFSKFRDVVYRDGYRKDMFRLIFQPNIVLSVYALTYCLSLRLFFYLSKF